VSTDAIGAPVAPGADGPTACRPRPDRASLTRQAAAGTTGASSGGPGR
jgi:hypothetical protein